MKKSETQGEKCLSKSHKVFRSRGQVTIPPKVGVALFVSNIPIGQALWKPRGNLSIMKTDLIPTFDS